MTKYTFTATFHHFGELHIRANNLDGAIDQAMQNPLNRKLKEGQQIRITSNAGHKIQVITLRRGRDHWKYPGYQFGQVDLSEFSGFDNGSQ